MEGADPACLCGVSEEFVESVFHFCGGFAGKCEDHDLVWWGVVLVYDVGDAVGEYVCFA